MTSRNKLVNLPYTFPHTATAAAFPLGGIGTGNISLGARGELRDWEIFNRPNLNGMLDFTFPLIWAKEKGKDPVLPKINGVPAV